MTFGDFFAKSFLISLKDKSFVFGNIFFAKSLLNKGRWVKGRHLRLKDTSLAFGRFFFLQRKNYLTVVRH